MPVVSDVKHIFEPNPLACGQAVIAMVTGVDVHAVVRMAGKDSETDLKDMRRLFKELSVFMAQERKEAQSISDIPEVALLSLETPRCWHWSLYFKGKVYDPEHGVLDSFPECKRKYYWELKNE